MESEFRRGIELQKNGDYGQSRSILTKLLSHDDYVSKAHLYIAWSYDNEGKEQQAISHYKLALSSGKLSLSERFEAIFGLACTNRSIGNYVEALADFELVISEYPHAIEVQPFYAMCLYNLGRYKEATAILLSQLVSTTDNEAIKKYERAIRLYAEDLDRKW